jgi:hypothetical protein
MVKSMLSGFEVTMWEDSSLAMKQARARHHRRLHSPGLYQYEKHGVINMKSMGSSLGSYIFVRRIYGVVPVWG